MKGHCVNCGLKNIEMTPGNVDACPDCESTIKHDNHYKTMHIEPFDVMEQRMNSHNKPSHAGPSQKQKLALAIAIKHIMRAGHKTGQPWDKDIQKAMNYLNRALTGEWLGSHKLDGDGHTGGNGQ